MKEPIMNIHTHTLGYYMYTMYHGMSVSICTYTDARPPCRVPMSTTHYDFLLSNKFHKAGVDIADLLQ